MRVLTNRLLSISILMLCFYQPTSYADSIDIFAPVISSCGEIVDNYLDAVGEFNSILEAMLPLSNEQDVTNAINNALNGIQNNNITYNAMQAYEGSIKEELKKYPNSALNEGMSQLDSQLSSLHTRVNQWKSNHTGCRKKFACDLGEPGYCDEKH